MSSRIRVLACALLIASFARAEEWTPTRSFRMFSKAQWRGLPQSSVVALAQGSDGVLWIGTLDGVASFDGKSITPVPDVKGAPLRGLITSIVRRREGGVYVASQYGVHRFDGSQWRLIETKRGVASIAEDRTGVVWMVDGDGAVWTLKGDALQKRSEFTATAIAISAGADGSIWIATPDSALRFRDGRVEAVGGAPLPSRPTAILAASDGTVWIGTQGCTVHWSRGGSHGWQRADVEPWNRGAVRTLAEDRRGRIWAGSIGGGASFGTASSKWTTWTPANGTPFEFGVMSILGDREGTVWFGLNSAGLAQWVGEAWSHRIAVDPNAAPRRGFGGFGIARSEFSGDLLVAAFQMGGLRFGKDGVRQYATAEGLTEDVRAFVEAEPGTLLAGTRFGVFESKGGHAFRQVLKLERGFVMGLFHGADRRWYAATSTDGVYVRNGETWEPEAAINAGIDNKHVRAMLWRRNGELWIATLRGVNIFRDGKLVGRLSSQQNPAIPESVNALLEISDGEIWIGGTGGLAVQKHGTWKRTVETDGLPGQTIYSLAASGDGSVWAGGSAGVGRFAGGKWTVWDSRSGMLLEECNLNGLHVYDDGSVYVGTLGGLARFDPSVSPLPAPKLQLRWLSRPAQRLASGDRALHLKWSAPWLDPRPVEYRTRIPRLREGWSAPSYDDHLDIENLGAGRWRVEVAARVEGTQLWNDPLTLDVEVAPYWYETWPARAAIAALLSLLIYGAVRLRLRALRRHAAMLEETVQERTAQLAEKMEALRESEQRALSASRAKSAFLANMSHELRTPLNGVLGFAQLLARRKDRDAEDREGLGVIMSSGEHLLSLINDVLSLSKIEAGSVTLEKTDFDPRRVLRDVEKVLRLRAEEKRIRFDIDVDESQMPHAVNGDEVRLRQILLNLAGNAVKFTERGQVVLRARWRAGRAAFEVDDTGPGISADELPRLFEPFVQTDAGRRAKEGTGLGLAVSRHLAQLMDGDITVESTPGKGSRFRLDIALPLAEVKAQVPDERRVASLAPGQGPVRILIADDTPVNRTVLSRLLTQAGFEVRAATNGAEAVETWREWRPALVWMDWRMNEMDGLEATRRIRAEEAARGLARTPILALSASALDHERGQILAAGCDDFVAKPYREATIFAKIHEFAHVEYVFEDQTAVPQRESQAVNMTKAQVLLVDDDWVCREVATEALRVQGVAVAAVSSAAEALELLARDHFDLVLMDLQMPGMSGIEASRRIKADPRTARLPIIAMSADTFDGEPGRLAQSGLDDYVAKPVQPDTLATVVARWLRRV
jgi:signal transduction histidine kinase/CheY-like chemotaxis protein/ligand-binding sensor domain-containing protein